MNRRYFFQRLASGLIAASAPALFLPKLIKPKWQPCKFSSYEIPQKPIIHINSSGGSVEDALVIAEALRDFGSRLTPIPFIAGRRVEWISQ